MRDPDAFLISRLRFRHLSVIEALGSLGSIRKAAQVLHLSEPAVSKALGEIESSFGYRLFERSAAGVAPTPQGASVIEGATLLINSLKHVRRSAASVGEEVVLRLGAIPFIGMTVLPRVLHAMQAQGPGLRVELREGTSPELIDLLRRGEIDAVLTTLSPELVGSDGAALAFTPLFSETLSIMAPPGHPLARKRAVPLADLRGERWILPAEGTVTTVAVRNAFVARGLVPPRPWIESSGVHASIEFVAAGLGLCAAPMAMARAARRRGLVVELKIDQPIELPPVCFACRQSDGASQANARLRAALAREGWAAPPPA